MVQPHIWKVIMATIEVACRFCEQTKPVKKHGTGLTGHQRFRCLDCKRTFQLDYAYEAWRQRQNR